MQSIIYLFLNANLTATSTSLYGLQAMRIVYVCLQRQQCLTADAFAVSLSIIRQNRTQTPSTGLRRPSSDHRHN